MGFRKLHPSTAGILSLLIGGVLRLVSLYANWPIGLVIAAHILMLGGAVWILAYDFFPIFLLPFFHIKERYKRRYSFFFLLFALFMTMQLLAHLLPSGPVRDNTTELAFISFLTSIAWISGIYALSTVRPFLRVFRRFKRVPREQEKITFSDVVTSMVVVIAPTVALSYFFAPPGLSKVAVTPYTVFLTGFITAVFVGAYLYLSVLRPRVMTQRQLGFRSVDREHIGRAFVLFVFVSVLIFLMHALLERFGVPVKQYSFADKNGALLALITVAVITPFIEETYFRGYLFRGLLLHHKRWVAYVVSAGLFALLHPPLLVMADVFIIGLLLAYVTEQTKSLWPGIFIHALNNAVVFAFLLYR